MFERFTDRARRVVVLAQEEARRLNHSYIGTEHLLLGVIHDGEGVGAKALASLGISLETVRQQVEVMIGEGGGAVAGHIPFTPRAKKALELSLREALQLSHNYIGTEHILLGLVRVDDGVAAQVLLGRGLGLADVRAKVLSLLADLTPAERAEAVAGAGPVRTPSLAGGLFMRAQAEATELGHVVGPEHFLLALLRQSEGLALEILRDADLTYQAVRERVIGAHRDES